MDLNHILLLVSIASPLIVLVQLRAAERKRGWRLVSAAVLVVTLAAWLVLPTLAGYLGGCFWLAFFFCPRSGCVAPSISSRNSATPTPGVS